MQNCQKDLDQRNTSSLMGSSISSMRMSNENLCKEVFINQLKKLQSKLQNNKIFMNMAIHDMRNPTLAIMFGVTETI